MLIGERQKRRLKLIRTCTSSQFFILGGIKVGNPNRAKWAFPVHLSSRFSKNIVLTPLNKKERYLLQNISRDISFPVNAPLWYTSTSFQVETKVYLKFSTLNGHMIKCLLIKFGRAGRENIWLSVSAAQLIDKYIILHSITHSRSVIVRYHPHIS